MERGARRPSQPEGLSFLKSAENKDETAKQVKGVISNTPKHMHMQAKTDFSRSFLLA